MSIGLRLKEVVKYAPLNPVVNPELHGWLVTEDSTEFVCAHCAARVMARGCWRWNGGWSSGTSSPVWSDSPNLDSYKCCCCEV